jgi:hypothetical protein
LNNPNLNKGTVFSRIVLETERIETRMWSNFWKDFHSEHEWRFPEIAPLQIQRSLGNPVVDHWERVRAEWMWQRRPRTFLGEGAFGYVLIIVVGLLVLLIPVMGVFLDAFWLLSCFLLVALDVVRNVRWRRDYETSLCRMIRTIQSRESI